jgi:prepilin-type N-terminal cleavage/methylation domain-containing protein
MKARSSRSSSSGFTIIELLIALSVFAVVMILITTGVLKFSRQYYEGVIQGKTQDTARAIIDDITRSIQFSGGDVTKLTTTTPAQLPDPTKPAVGYCFGLSKRYRFYLNSQVTDQSPNASLHQHNQAIVSDTVTGCSANTVADSVQDANVLTDTNARELLGEHMRLAKLDITGTDKVWTVTVRVVYGDDDLLCNQNIPNNCDPGGSFPAATDNLKCRPDNGSQFCAMSELSTTIDKRVK